MEFHVKLVANADTIFYFAHDFYQQNQQPLYKLSNSFAKMNL